MTAASVAESTALGVNADMGEGIIARFRTMAIWRPSVLAGPVTGSVVRTLITGAAVCLFAFALGFSPKASALEWLAAIGLFVLLGMALSWLTVAFGLLAKTISHGSDYFRPGNVHLILIMVTHADHIVDQRVDISHHKITRRTVHTDHGFECGRKHHSSTFHTEVLVRGTEHPPIGTKGCFHEGSEFLEIRETVGHGDEKPLWMKDAPDFSSRNFDIGHVV